MYTFIQHIEPAACWEFDDAVWGWLRVFLGTEE